MDDDLAGASDMDSQPPDEDASERLPEERPALSDLIALDREAW